jgi:type IV pilus assembly protein PilY1
MAAQVIPSTAFAVTDDTELFFNPYIQPAARPNILFILDTSGSMDECIGKPGTHGDGNCTAEESRIGNMQGALSAVLADSKLQQRINAGFMHFDGKTSNHPIYYPVEPLDAAANTVATEGSATGTVAQRITALVNKLKPGGFTPIAPVLYEGIKYMKGDPVDYGALEVAGKEGGNLGKHGVSHQAAVSGGIFLPAGCSSALDFGDPGTRCTSIGGSPTYISPLTADRQVYFNDIDFANLPNGEKETTNDTPPKKNAILLDGSKIRVVPKPSDCAAADYIILLTDGLPTWPNASSPPIAEDITFNNKAWTFSGHSGTPNCVTNPGGNEGKCAFELAKYFHQPTPVNFDPASGPIIPGDLRSLSGYQWGIMYTIGFSLANIQDGQDYLRRVATAGGGRFFDVENKNQLIDVLNQILAGALKGTSTGFATPRFSTQAFNRLYSGDEVYVSLFKPNQKVRWIGNVKKYRACTDLHLNWSPTTKTCNIGANQFAFGTILDKNDNALVVNGDINPSASDLWSNTSNDGANVRTGGAGANLLDRVTPPNTGTDRQLYTYTGTYATNGRQPGTGATVTAGGAPIIDPLNKLDCVTNSASLTNANVPTGLCTATGAPPLSVVDWIRDHGPDVDDEDNDSTTKETWQFEDPMHASAVPIQFGFSDNTTFTKVFVPTNGGSLRMLNGGGVCTFDAQGRKTNPLAPACNGDGKEEWMFIPQELLSLQQVLKTNPKFTVPSNTVPPALRSYGLDGSPIVWTRDVNGNGITNETGDFVRLIFGQRDGGRRYYAVDITATGSSASTATVAPKLLWKIDPATDSNFTDLASTWSRPAFGKLRLGDTDASGNPVLTDVLIFGGGNDTTLNDKFGPVTSPNIKGNAVFIVRADTGERVANVGLIGGNTIDATGTQQPNINTTNSNATMNYPVVSNIVAFDSNGDGTTDRLYYGDLGGNLWRTDLLDPVAPATTLTLVTQRIAHLADDNTSTPAGPIQLANADPTVVPPVTASSTPNFRAFYFAPEVVRIDNAQFGGRFDLVVIGTGQAGHPLDLTVHNAIYAVKDSNVAPLVAGTNLTAIDPTQLTDLTDNPLQRSATGNPPAGTTVDTTLAALKTSKGWFIKLKEGLSDDAANPAGWIGEKSYSQPVVVGGKLFYTTFIPPTISDMQNAANPNICKPALGRGRIYARDLLTGSSIFKDWNTKDSTKNPDNTAALTKDDVYREDNGPPPSEIGLGIRPDDIIVASQSPLKAAPAGTGLPRGRIYWHER